MLLAIKIVPCSARPNRHVISNQPFAIGFGLNGCNVSDICFVFVCLFVFDKGQSEVKSFTIQNISEEPVQVRTTDK